MHASALSKHYLELARKPVNDSNFAGDDIRYSSEFELLEAELAKAGRCTRPLALTGRRSARAARRCSLAVQDLRAAAWLTWSLFQRESLPGCRPA